MRESLGYVGQTHWICFFPTFWAEAKVIPHAEKRIFAHIWLHLAKCTGDQALFSGAFRSGKLRGTTFCLTRLFNRPSINGPVETSPHNRLVLFWSCWDLEERKRKSNFWVVLCAFGTHHCGTVVFPLTYLKKGCKRRKGSVYQKKQKAAQHHRFNNNNKIIIIMRMIIRVMMLQ